MSEIQRRLLGALLMDPPTAVKVAPLVRPDEFSHPAYRLMYETMIETVNSGREFDDATLQARMRERGMSREVAEQTVVGCTATYASPHAWEEYAGAVRNEAGWTRAENAHSILTDALRMRDVEARREAVRLLTESPGGGWVDSIESLHDDVWARMTGERGRGLPLPFESLNRALGGGLAPGEVTVIGGWTSHCKSTLAMQAADELVGRDSDVVYMTNEMRRDEVALRVAAAHGGPPFGSLRQGQVTASQASKLAPAIGRIALKVVDAFARTCEEVCAYLLALRPDLAVIDLFNRFPRPGGGTAELDNQITRICDTASRSGAHILLVSQLNRSRLTTSQELPHPTLGDLRDTGALATHPANVLFTYLTDQEGIREGYVEVAKARNGQVGVSVDVTLNPNTMRLVRTA